TPWLTQTMGLLAVLLGSNVSPIRYRLPPFLAWTVLSGVCRPSVLSALRGNRSISPSSVAAYSRLSGPIVTAVYVRPLVVGSVTRSNAIVVGVGVGVEDVGVDPVVNVDENGTNGWPVTSLTP